MVDTCPFIFLWVSKEWAALFALGGAVLDTVFFSFWKTSVKITRQPYHPDLVLTMMEAL